MVEKETPKAFCVKMHKVVLCGFAAVRCQNFCGKLSEMMNVLWRCCVIRLRVEDGWRAFDYERHATLLWPSTDTCTCTNTKVNLPAQSLIRTVNRSSLRAGRRYGHPPVAICMHKAYITAHHACKLPVPWQVARTMAPWQVTRTMAPWQVARTMAPWQVARTMAPWQVYPYHGTMAGILVPWHHGKYTRTMAPW